MKLLGISASLSPRSKTLLAVKKAVDFSINYSPNIEAELLNLKDYDIQFCDGRDPENYTGDTKAVINKILEADAFIIGTPIYRGSLSGALKNVFDVIPNHALRGKVIGFIATGGTYHHFLAIEHQLHPIAGYFSAYVVPGGVYVNNDHYSDSDLVSSEILGRIEQLGKSINDMHVKLGGSDLGVEKPMIPRLGLI
jgi:NAD(P)H-dependent FMN reductase